MTCALQTLCCITTTKFIYIFQNFLKKKNSTGARGGGFSYCSPSPSPSPDSWLICVVPYHINYISNWCHKRHIWPQIVFKTFF